MKVFFSSLSKEECNFSDSEVVKFHFSASKTKIKVTLKLDSKLRYIPSLDDPHEIKVILIDISPKQKYIRQN